MTRCRYKYAWAALLLMLFAQAGNADKLEEIADRGIVRIGVSLGGAPMGFYNWRNEPSGYDVDMAVRFAEKLGVDAEFTNVFGDARVSMLVSGQLDVVIANMTATATRAKSVDFSIPYLKSGLRVIAHKDSAIVALDDLDGKKIVVGRGSSGEVFIRGRVPGATLVYTDNFSPNALLLLKQNRVDAAIEDNSLIDYLAEKNSEYVLVPELFLSGPISIGMAQGDPDFVRWVDDFVAEYISSGDYERAHRKWWGDSITPPTLDSSLQTLKY
jgi:polar amino acid transport system substrate-binding protein